MSKKTGWIATETMAMKQKHYFLTEDGESLCGKLFNTSRKINTEVTKYCEKCEKILFEKDVSITVTAEQSKVEKEQFI